LTHWGDGAPLPVPAWARPAAFLAGLANVVVLAGAAWFGWPALAALGVLLASALLSLRLKQPVATIVADAGRPARELDLVAALVARLEVETFDAPLLVSLRDRFTDRGGTAVSRRIARLHRLVGLLDSRKNQLFMPLAALLLWTTQCALAIEAWRRRSGGAIGRWIETLGEFEALAALATFADERPDYTWPEVTAGPARFEATGLAHPLLPRAGTVANDLALGEELRLMVVSGSNMSGKSTMLRAVGVNAVLAQAGGPVRAGAMRLSGLALGASFRAVDSLREGQSRFYAEIARIRRIMDLLDTELPVLFLLDELLSGTNSHDRLIGARAIVEHLVRQGAIGLITTHDLALAGIADSLGRRAVNVHFEDHLEEGRLAFDYRLRPGVVQRSNALELMRSVGLEV
ncbi:MAG: DNA mismatch repair protein MutS, partial [Gemmatimonadota bacterium]|nr:DNA mismatch repair protein MutS [Gemmatimonadota bacterium]